MIRKKVPSSLKMTKHPRSQTASGINFLLLTYVQ